MSSFSSFSLNSNQLENNRLDLQPIDEEKKSPFVALNGAPLAQIETINSTKQGFWNRITSATSNVFKKTFGSNQQSTTHVFGSLKIGTNFPNEKLGKSTNMAHRVASRTSVPNSVENSSHLLMSNPEEVKRFTGALMAIQKKTSFSEIEKKEMGINASSLFEQKSEALIYILEQKKLKSLDRFKQFVEENKKKTDAIIDFGWKALKADLKDKMATEVIDKQFTLETFRVQLVEAINAIRQEVLLHMGFSSPGSHSATGTPGYDSDIDTVFLAPQGMPHAIQTHVKILFDELCYNLLKGFSSDKIDTESYTNHGAGTLKTELHLKNASIEAKREFSRQEDTLACLQTYRAFIAQDPPNHNGWEKYKADELDAAYSPHYRVALMEKFTQVETHEHNLKAGIQRQMIRECSDPHLADQVDQLEENELGSFCTEIMRNNPEALRLAEKGYSTTRLINLSERMDQTAASLEGVRQEMHSGELSVEDLSKLKKREEYLLLSLNADDGLRRSNFPESYLTDGAFNRVCYYRGGQIYERQVEEVQRGMRKYSASTRKLSNASTLSPTSSFTSGRKSSASSSSSPIIPFHLALDQQKEAGPQDTLSSQQENLAMYIGHFMQKVGPSSDFEHYQNALISTSKYSERTMQATQALADLLPLPADVSLNAKPSLQDVEQVAKQLMQSLGTETAPIKDIQTLKKQCEALHFITSELKNCKRRDQLNYNATKNQLKELLKKTNFDEVSVEELLEAEQALEITVQLILSDSDPHQGKLYTDESLTPEDRYSYLVHLLVGLKYVEFKDSVSAEGLEVTTVPRLDSLLKLRAGLSLIEQDQNLSVSPDEQQLFAQMHEDAAHSTLKYYGFNSPAIMQQFNQKIETLSRQIKNLALKQNITETPTIPLLGLGLAERWMNLN